MSLFNLPHFFGKKNRRGGWNREIDPDEILIDAENLPKFDQNQFEGRLEKPIGKSTVVAVGLIFGIVLLLFFGKISVLQIKDGATFARKSTENTLQQSIIFQERGIILDRNGVILSSNVSEDNSNDFAHRVYAPIDGIAHTAGYVRYPAKDPNGFYYQDKLEGVDGIERIFNERLSGKRGLKIVETNALGKVETESVIEPPIMGENLTLSVDSRVQSKLYNVIADLSSEIGFTGGAGIIMDIDNGEIIASASYPEYDSNIMSDRNNNTAIRKFLNDARKPFLNRVTDGLYTPGSIIKPFVALAALNENVIDPKTKILSTGSISIQNPFDPTKKTIFRDWKAHGYVDMRDALAVSSDVYFYEIGGGFENQKGLGIENINLYMRMFGFGESIKGNPLVDYAGTIPSPAWKKENFEGEDWRIGDTYNTSIGQYGFQVTLIQAVRATASIGNGGILLEPSILHDPHVGLDNTKKLPFSDEQIKVAQEGMRQAVLAGTAKGLDIPQVKIAGKTGTAELGTSKKYVNSWIVGFFPYEKPRYAFASIMEKGPYENTIGALYAMRQLFEWMSLHTPEYFKV